MTKELIYENVLLEIPEFKLMNDKMLIAIKDLAMAEYEEEYKDCEIIKFEWEDHLELMAEIISAKLKLYDTEPIANNLRMTPDEIIKIMTKNFNSGLNYARDHMSRK